MSTSTLFPMSMAEDSARNEWKLKAIQDAKREAEKGIFISQEATLDWLDSWGMDQEREAPMPDIYQ